MRTVYPAGALASSRPRPPLGTFAQEVLRENPYAYLKLDETSGTAAADSSGHSRGGTYTGTCTLNQAPLIAAGHSVLFPTPGDGYVISTWHLDTPILFTTVVWIQWDGTVPASGHWSYVAGWCRGHHSAPGDRHILISPNGKAAVQASDGVSFHTLEGSTTLTAGTYMLAGRYDGSNLRVYVNGAADASTTYAQQSGLQDQSGPNFMVGASAANTGPFTYDEPFVNGITKIDECAIWNRSVKTSAIADMYAARAN